MTNKLIENMCKVLSSKKAENITIVDVNDLTVITDYFIVCSAPSSPLVKTLSDELEDKMAEDGIVAKRKEGYHEARWIVLDYGDIIVHIFHNEERGYYDIEKLWANESNITVFED